MKNWKGLSEYWINLISRPQDRLLKRVTLVCLLLLLFSPSTIFAQQKDSTRIRKNFQDLELVKVLKSSEHSARKATLYSALIPGWGQAYNRKYWKIPIVWGAIGGVGYYYFTNQHGYATYEDYYIALSQNPDTTLPIGFTFLTVLYSDISKFRDNRDLSVLIMAAVWGLNVIDANVDGHFFNFDIDEDLSLNFQPASWFISDRKQAYGLSLVLTMH